MLCLFIFFSIIFAHQQKEIPKVVQVAKATSKKIKQSIRLIGTIEAKRSIFFTAKTTGTLNCLVPAGEKVLKNTVIMKLDNQDLTDTYLLSQKKEQIAKTQYERILKLAKNQTSSRQETEERYRIWLEAKNEATKQMEQTRFSAPFDGIVGAYKMRDGSQVQVGDRLVAFYDPSELIVTFDVPEPVLKNIHESSFITINNQSFPFHVQKIIDPDTHMAPAFASFQSKDCIIGTSIYITLNLQEKNKSIVIPQESIFFYQGEPNVYVVKEGKVYPRIIKTGIREKANVEITEGLNEGEIFVSLAPQRLYPECKVKF